MLSTHFRWKDTHRREVKSKKRYFMKMETNKQKTGVVILMPDKNHFKNKALTRDKEGPSSSTSGYLYEEIQNTQSKRHVILMLIAALFIIAKICKQPTCLSIDEWIKKCCVYMMECDSAIKKMKSCHRQQRGWTWRYCVE